MRRNGMNGAKIDDSGLQFRNFLEFIDRVETHRATAAICDHSMPSCNCFEKAKEFGQMPEIPFSLVQQHGKILKVRSRNYVDSKTVLPIPSLFIVGEKTKKSTNVPMVRKKANFAILKENEEVKRRREIKKKLFMDLGIVRTNSGIDNKERKREDAMKRKVTETIVTTYCQLCEQNFSSSKMLLLHNTKVHETSTLECHLCLQQFNQTILFNKHMKTHYGPNAQYLVQCELCERKFKDKDTLTTHMSVTHFTTTPSTTNNA